MLRLFPFPCEVECGGHGSAEHRVSPGRCSLEVLIRCSGIVPPMRMEMLHLKERSEKTSKKCEENRQGLVSVGGMRCKASRPQEILMFGCSQKDVKQCLDVIALHCPHC